MAHKSATGRISNACVHKKKRERERDSGQGARSWAVQQIVTQCQINDGRKREGKDGWESTSVGGRRELQGAVREQISHTHSH